MLGPSINIPLAALLLWLFSLPLAASQTLMWQVLRWVGFFLDRQGWVEKLSYDPLDAPGLMGPSGRKVLRIPASTKAAVCRIAAAGDGARSNAKVLRLHKRMCKTLLSKSSASAANTWMEDYMAHYWTHVRDSFRSVEDKVFSLAWDGVKVSGMDVLVSTVYSSCLSQAAWLPPMAPRIMPIWEFQSGRDFAKQGLQKTSPSDVQFCNFLAEGFAIKRWYLCYLTCKTVPRNAPVFASTCRAFFCK